VLFFSKYKMFLGIILGYHRLGFDGALTRL
jgi:hypothetical protein